MPRLLEQVPLPMWFEQAKRSAPRREQGPPQQPQNISPDSSDFGRRAPFSRFFL